MRPEALAAWFVSHPVATGLSIFLSLALIILTIRHLRAMRKPRLPAHTGGKWIGSWRILGPLGHGGMSEIFQAIRDGESVTVSLKMPPEDAAADPEFKARFRREIDLCARLHHPGIVRVLDSGETEDGRPYLVTELVEGQTLRALVQPGGIEVERARAIFLLVLEAMVYAHSQGVLHRNLKPDNIVLRPDGSIKLIDFGLARPPDDSADITGSGKSLGTPAYMPPEQILGTAMESSDQYAIGVTLYELLAGRRPFEAHDVRTQMFQNLNLPPSPIEGCPEPLNALVLKMMEKDPSDRFESLAACHKALSEMGKTG